MVRAASKAGEGERFTSHPRSAATCKPAAQHSAEPGSPDTEEVTGSIPVTPTFRPPDQHKRLAGACFVPDEGCAGRAVTLDHVDATYRGSRITATRPPGPPSQVAHRFRIVAGVALNGELL